MTFSGIADVSALYKRRRQRKHPGNVFSVYSQDEGGRGERFRQGPDVRTAAQQNKPTVAE